MGGHIMCNLELSVPVIELKITGTTFSELRMQISKPKFDSHEASFDSQTRTSTRVSTARFTRETMQGANEA
jgi:hypothetical protein